tara:strand:+ start:409 stop:729 length:321 start_codon:yes stop_codon:yes gene_type:complete
MATFSTNNTTFDQDILTQDFLILIDFWAEWCGPCKQISPILEEISEEKKDKVKIFKLNVDENREIAQKYGVSGIPTLMIFRDGKLIDTKIGSLPKSNIIDWIENNL